MKEGGKGGSDTIHEVRQGEACCGLALKETATPCFFRPPGVWVAGWSLASGAGLGIKQCNCGLTKPKGRLRA